ncbi:VCBS repeat protein [Actinoplanes xinjiangensis]|uniref:VCBS repeat protein n=1 Tax=Actinoplanes xinjiangensis TaxID=512350 RepID=A0A316FL44_9ACTN|nr:VCBS repeat-containing protein [Actinoplanes xinjiangensis]PWK48832.1 VCBS repeat protein [Actinoplanes xinjiangensis]
MRFSNSIKRAVTVVLAGGMLVTLPSVARAEEPAAGTLAITLAACDPDGTTATDAASAARLNGMLNGKVAGDLDAYRVSCAREVIRAVRERGMPRRAAVIAITTVIVETEIRNIVEKLDHTSVGLFQQQDWWGTEAQRLDPIRAANAFLNAMEREYPNDSWQNVAIGTVCQEVQESGFGDRYAPQVSDAGKIVDELWDHAFGRTYDSFNGDARADMIVHAGTEVSVRKGGSGGGFDGGAVVTSGWGRYHGMQVTDGLGRLHFADFNNDHFTDMIVHHGSDVSVRYNNGKGVFDGGRTVSTGWGRYHGLDVANGLGRLHFADFTGDGRADMIVHHGSDVSVRHNVGEGFDGGHAVTSGWGRYHGVQAANGLGRLFFADLNSDDKADMVVHDGSDVSVRYNTSGGFDGGRIISSGWGRYHGLDAPNGLGRLHFADYDGDQLDDMIVHDGSDVSVRLNVGGGFDGGRTVTSGWGRFHGMQITDGLGRLYFS